jgi:hypothetical protein
VVQGNAGRHFLCVGGVTRGLSRDSQESDGTFQIEGKGPEAGELPLLEKWLGGPGWLPAVDEGRNRSASSRQSWGEQRDAVVGDGTLPHNAGIDFSVHWEAIGRC